MKLTAKLLNSDATLNSWIEISSVDFIPGEQKKIVLQLFELNEALRYMPNDAATLKLNFNKTDGTTLEKVAAKSFAPDDRSIWNVTLLATETEDLFGGDIVFELTESGAVSKGLIQNGFRKRLISC